MDQGLIPPLKHNPNEFSADSWTDLVRPDHIPVCQSRQPGMPAQSLYLGTGDNLPKVQAYRLSKVQGN